MSVLTSPKGAIDEAVAQLNERTMGFAEVRDVPRGTKQHYFITGLPRCRSAWFANYLTWGDSFCYHDAFHTRPTFEAFCQMLEDNPAQHVGHADPANVLFWRELHVRFPNAKWVVVQRPAQEAWSSTISFVGRVYAGSWDGFHAFEKGLAEVLANLSPKLVTFKDPQPAEVAKWLGVDAGGPARLELLERLNVQIDTRHVRDILTNLAPNHWLREAA